MVCLKKPDIIQIKNDFRFAVIGILKHQQIFFIALLGCKDNKNID